MKVEREIVEYTEKNENIAESEVLNSEQNAKTLSKRRVAYDFLLSLAGVALMHAVLQFWFYPQMNRIYGPIVLGKILFLISVVSVFVMAFGMALDNSRLVTRHRFRTLNGDFNWILGVLSLISVGICLPMAWYVFPEMNLWKCTLWIILTLMRFYSAVEFRLRINCVGYFAYHALLALGYGVGAWLLFHGLDWVSAFCLGEAAALVLVVASGTIYRSPFWKTANFRQTLRSVAILSGAGILNQGGQNLDRILLPAMIGALANTQFYVVSLLGKILSMFVTPLNSVLISYLTRDSKPLRRRYYILIISIVLTLTALFWGACYWATPIFLQIFYPNLYSEVLNLVAIATLGQVLGVTSSLVMTIVLTIAKESWQLRLQVVYATIFCLLVVPMTFSWRLWGFALAILIANTVRLFLAILLGYLKTPKETTL